MCPPDPDELSRLKSEAAVIIYGGKDCSVCQAVTPKIEALVRDEYPRLALAYLDCQGSDSEQCAQAGIFTLPTVQLWFAGSKFAEFSRVFSLAQLREAIDRPYRLTFEGDS